MYAVQKKVMTYVGISGGGRAPPWGLPGGIGGAPPPGRLGTAGAGRPVLGGGGGTRELPVEPKEPNVITIINKQACRQSTVGHTVTSH